MYQYSQPVGSWINQYVADDAQAVGVLSRPRITGTFSYIGGMGSFLLFSLFFALGIVLSGFRDRRRFYQILGGSLLGLALIVAPMNGSRSVVFGFLLPLPLVLYAVLRHQRGLAVGASLLLLAAGGLYVATESAWVTQGWEVIEHRMNTASDQDTRVQTALLDPIRKIPVGGLIGYGAGTTHQAAAALSSQGRIQIDGVGYEGEPGRVIIELGVIGGLLYLALKAWIAWIGWQALRRSSSTWTTMLSVMSFSMLFYHLGTGMIVFNHVSSALYWICAGCALWVWSRQELRIRHQRQPVTHA
jgi:O-antigen ligase